jgi:hypothetical protein
MVLHSCYDGGGKRSLVISVEQGLQKGTASALPG